MKEQDHAIEILIASCDSLARRFEDFAEAPERVEPWPEHIRRASALVEEALRNLQKYELGVPSAIPGTVGPTISRLASRLLGEEAGTKILEAGIASRDRGERSEGLRGYSWAISIPDLLGFLKLQRKTGLLTVTLGKEVALIELEVGVVVSAISDNAPKDARLGYILVDQGAVSRGRFESLLVHAGSKQKLGSLLESEGLISRDQLRTALETQIQMLFNRLFESQDAYFTFVEGPPSDADGRVKIDVTRLLLESARTQDERERSSDPNIKPIDWKTIGRSQ